MELLRGVLTSVGIHSESLEETGPESRLRADLGLDSTETTDLQLELSQRFGLTVDLWDQVDYTLGQLAEHIGGSGKSRETTS